MSPFVLIFFGVMIVVGIIGALAGLGRARRKKLAAYAAARGYRFSPRKFRRLPEDLAKQPAFARGHSRYAENTISGRLTVHETPLVFHMGDYHYATTSRNGKSSSTKHHHFSYVACRLAGDRVPRVAIRRENFFDTISAAFGFDDIDFESAEFSKRFHVSSDDKRFAYDLIHPRTMELLLADSPQGLELRGGWLGLTDGGKRWEPEAFDRWLVWIGRFLEHWPRHLDASPTAARSGSPAPRPSAR